ncbi:MAG: histidine phosphatase family protein [Gammaproteobacteria bacterium]|nr:histidine phosphatase family protein [Gammaproteobacteria bacterium]
MKRVTLMRHAKSSWSTAGLSDHDRPLNQRGQRDTPVMARRLLDKNIRPSLIITSSAKRALETSKLLARNIGYPIEFMHTEKSLYLADENRLLETIELQEDTFNDIVICAHNPGITDLANRLTRQSIENVPTCGMVTIEADTDHWSNFSEASRSLMDFDYPKKSD